jgi:hypothetical protein
MESGNKPVRDHSGKRLLRRTAIILGIIGAVLGMAASFLSCVINIQMPGGPQLIYSAIVSWLLNWIVLAVAFIWPLVGGVLLIIDSLCLTIFVFIFDPWWFPFKWTPETKYFPSSEYFLPAVFILLASGIFFILWGIKRRIQNNT